MKIIRAKKMGFCFGVKEAINSCVEVAHEIEKGKKVYILGMLVHNEHVVNELKKMGLQILEEEELLNGEDSLNENDIVIIRAHGTTKEVYELLQRKKVQLNIDRDIKLYETIENISEKINDSTFMKKRTEAIQKPLVAYANNELVTDEFKIRSSEISIHKPKKIKEETALTQKTIKGKELKWHTLIKYFVNGELMNLYTKNKKKARHPP